MKKALGVLSVLVLITVMMISCNAEQKVNDTIKVSFNVSSSRALTVENQNFEPVNSGDLTWYYHGEKKTDKEFITGQSASMNKTSTDYWTRISTGDELSATFKEFSQGQWYFEVKAIKNAGTDNATQMYYGKTNGNVLLTKGNNTISISVSPFVSGVKGTLKIESVYIDPKDAGSKNVAPNMLLINGIEKTYTESTDKKSISFTELVEPGTYTVEVKRFGEDEGIVLASASKTVVVYSGLTTTIKGSVEEDTTSGKFDPQPIKPEGTETVTIPTTGDAEVKFVNVTPSMKADKSTTVKIPYAAVPSGTSAVTLDIVVKDSESVANNSFNVGTVNGVAASISLTMKNGDTAITEFGSNKVTVETYIETGLSGVTVKYNGTGTTGNLDPDSEDTNYDPVTGKLTFKTTHFSEFYVEAEIVAKIGAKGYLTLQKAIDAAKSGETINLIKDCTGSGLGSADGAQTRASLTIDFNRHTYTMMDPAVGSKGTETQAMHWGTSLGAITLKNGTFKVAEGATGVKMAMQNYIYFTAEGMTFDFTAIPVYRYGNNYTGANAVYNGLEVPLFNNGNGGTMVLRKCTISMPGLSEKGISNDGNEIIIDTCTINGAVVIESANKVVKVKGSNITKGVSPYFNSGYTVKRSEVDGYTVYTNQTVVNVYNTEELANAINQNSEVAVKLAEAGTYELPQMSNKEVSIIGTKDTVIDMRNKLNNNAKSISFEGVTVNFGTDNYCGFQHTGKLTYRDCTITGLQFLYAEEVEFNNCVFEQNIVDYNVWTYGAGNVLFKDCTFNCAGKSVLIYKERSNIGQTVEFKNCKFSATAPVDGKAAIEIDSSLLYDNGIYTVIIDQATANSVSGFGMGSVSKNSVWNNKLGNKATVIVGGNTVLSASKL